MYRDPSLLRGVSHPVHLFAESLIGEGRYGRVFRGRIRGKKENVALKFSRRGGEECLVNEAEIYSRLKSLSGRAIPRYYGLFHGEFEGSTYHMLLLSYEGESLESFEGISMIAK